MVQTTRHFEVVDKKQTNKQTNKQTKRNKKKTGF